MPNTPTRSLGCLGLAGFALTLLLACTSSPSSSTSDDENTAGAGGDSATPATGGSPAGAGGNATAGAGGSNAAGMAGANAGGAPAGGSTTGGAGGVTAPIVIDTHTHFWDATRANPPGRSTPIPFPGSDSPLYRKLLPAEYATKRAGTGITGTIVVEASGWLEDNQFILDLAKTSPEILGVVGSFGEVLGTNKFDATLARFMADPLFRGVRVSGGDVAAALAQPARLAEFTKLANADLAVDTLGVAINDVIKLATAVPKLRVVVDHMAGVAALNPTSGWKQDIEALAGSAVAKRVYVKLSGLVESAGKPAPTDPARYTAALEHVWQKLGENQLLYSTNWPVSEINAPLATTANIVNVFLASKPAAARAKVFSANAVAAYKCPTQR